MSFLYSIVIMSSGCNETVTCEWRVAGCIWSIGLAAARTRRDNVMYLYSYSSLCPSCGRAHEIAAEGVGVI